MRCIMISLLILALLIPHLFAVVEGPAPQAKKKPLKGIGQPGAVLTAMVYQLKPVCYRHGKNVDQSWPGKLKAWAMDYPVLLLLKDAFIRWANEMGQSK